MTPFVVTSTNVPGVPSASNAPMANGKPAIGGLSLPSARPIGTPPVFNVPPPTTTGPYTSATMVPVPANWGTQYSAATTGVMGPPTRPPEKPIKEYEYDVTDSLAGTGIDIRVEEQLLTEMNWNSLDSSLPEARTGFALGLAGSRASFYGAGTANQPLQGIDEAATQAEFAAKHAEREWNDAAMRLALARVQEARAPFLSIAAVHQRAMKISREHNISLNLDLKNTASLLGRMRAPGEFPAPTVTVKTKVTGSGPDAAIVNTYGSWLPHDAYLVDQVSLLSLAVKQRLVELLGDADRIARNRQATSHGHVPDEWIVAAGPLPTFDGERHSERGGDGQGQLAAHMGLYSALNPRLNSLKRPVDGPHPSEPSTKALKFSSSLLTTMRELARAEREAEEARLRRRNKFKDGSGDAGSGAASSLSGSAPPGTQTPGTTEQPEKAMSKRELKRAQSIKASDTSASHANQNTTSSMFAGLLSVGSLFGKNKGKGKSYDWMTQAGSAGGGNSATARPGKTGAGVAGPGGSDTGLGLGIACTVPTGLTIEGRNRLGTWREDREKGRNVQLRDWIAVLEADGMEPMALQRAYDKLDGSSPR